MRATSRRCKAKIVRLAKFGQDKRGAEARLRLAEAHLRNKALQEAMFHYIWLWKNIPLVAPSLIGVRVSFMASELGELVSLYQPARERFRELRDRLSASIGCGATEDARLDWLVLNAVLGERRPTIEWFDRVKGDAKYAEMLDRLAYMLVPELANEGRWADVGRLYVDPLTHLQHAYEVVAHLAPRHRSEEELSAVHHYFRRQAAQLWHALLAAGRTTEARLIKAEAVRLDDTAQMRSVLTESTRQTFPGREEDC